MPIESDRTGSAEAIRRRSETSSPGASDEAHTAKMPPSLSDCPVFQTDPIRGRPVQDHRFPTIPWESQHRAGDVPDAGLPQLLADFCEFAGQAVEVFALGALLERALEGVGRSG